MSAFIHVIGQGEPFEVDQRQREEIRRAVASKSGELIHLIRGNSSWLIAPSMVIAIEDR